VFKFEDFERVEDPLVQHSQKTHNPVMVDLTRIFEHGDSQGSHVGERLVKMISESQRTVRPPFPRQIQVETSNICNHSCEFCAYTLMERPKRHMKQDLFRRPPAAV
jgi:radical SAM superfamily enzyme YgiQ (UPF0313 family)